MRLLLLLAGVTVSAQNVVFVEPVGKPARNELPLYQLAGSPEKYGPWLNNPSARRALKLYAQAFALLEAKGNSQKQPRDYYVALIPGGNHAESGFRLKLGDAVEDHARHAFIQLAPNADVFVHTMLHETGHVAMAMLAGGRQLPRGDVTSIPHSTATLSDRATAFSEGWAIHFEALQAHLDPTLRGIYHHESVRFGGGPYKMDEYYRHASDLATYAQSLTRYTEVRDNHFAFDTAFREPDYLRAQLEKARDFSTLRSPNQLLQSEGFQASFFFLWLMRGEAVPTEATVDQRMGRMLAAHYETFARAEMREDTPWLLEFLISYGTLFPEEKESILQAFLDVSHGVFVDAAARGLWREHYLAALRLDLENLKIEAIRAARRRWIASAMGDPKLLFSRLGPQIPCEVPQVQVRIVAFGEPQLLVFDANTAPAAILRLVPGLAAPVIEQWLRERESKPYGSLDDLRRRLSITVCQTKP